MRVTRCVADLARGKPADLRLGGVPGRSGAASSCSMPTFLRRLQADTAYALRCVAAASRAGADSVDLCPETNGGALPHEVTEAVRRGRGASRAADRHPLPQRFGVRVGENCCRGACGLMQVQGTINGIGERVGNVDLLTVILEPGAEDGLHVRRARQTPPAHRRGQVRRGDMQHLGAGASSYTGSSAFAHKGGLHASAIARFPGVNTPRIRGQRDPHAHAVTCRPASACRPGAQPGDRAGEPHPETTQQILDEVKQREAQGYSLRRWRTVRSPSCCCAWGRYKPISRWRRASA